MFHLAQVTPLMLLAAASDSRPSLGRLLREVEEQDARACDKDEGGCGNVQPLHRKLRAVPPLFTLILAWESGSADGPAVRALLDLVDQRLRVEEVYSEVDNAGSVRKSPHELRSMVRARGEGRWGACR